jgi:hypothetical protein
MPSFCEYGAPKLTPWDIGIGPAAPGTIVRRIKASHNVIRATHNVQMPIARTFIHRLGTIIEQICIGRPTPVA